MNKLAILILFLIPFNLPAQIVSASEVSSTDTLWFEGNIVKFPTFEPDSKAYLVELAQTFMVIKITVDVLYEGIEIYGFAENQDGQFHLLATTNTTDQTYFIGACVRFILVKSTKYNKNLPSYSVGFDFDLEMCK